MAAAAIVATPASAGPCREAAAAAAARHGVPLPILEAIAIVESGRTRDGRHAPWPWALNVEGRGLWPESREEALDKARAFVAERRSFDIGCFQINHRWHGDAFASLAQMVEPAANADYAARFLAALRRETGDWIDAVGLYHSRTEALARRYRARVLQALARLVPEPGAAPRSVAPASRQPASRSAALRGAAPPGPNASLFLAHGRRPAGGLLTRAEGRLVASSKGRP